MKRIFGILLLTLACIALGLFVSWGRERDISLVGRHGVSLSYAEF